MRSARSTRQQVSPGRSRGCELGDSVAKFSLGTIQIPIRFSSSHCSSDIAEQARQTPVVAATCKPASAGSYKVRSLKMGAIKSATRGSATEQGRYWRIHPSLIRGFEFVEQAGHIFGMLFLDRENFFQHAAGCRVVGADEVDHLAIAVDGDSLGDQVLRDHLA